MAANHPKEYWQAVAKGLEAESEKASVYVTHALSLGIAREAILRRVLIDETPGAYLVKTGLIREKSQGGVVSRQCDLLVYNPADDTPFYRMDDFVVIPAAMAKIVVEVKSGLNAKEKDSDLEQIMDIWSSNRLLSIQTMGFAYEGMMPETFIQHAIRLFKNDTANLPVCLAVHSRNYLGIRPATYALGQNLPFFLLKFGAFGADGAAMATAYFLQWYSMLLNKSPLELHYVKDWFNRVQLPTEAKCRIMSDGSVIEGDMP